MQYKPLGKQLRFQLQLKAVLLKVTVCFKYSTPFLEENTICYVNNVDYNLLFTYVCALTDDTNEEDKESKGSAKTEDATPMEVEPTGEAKVEETKRATDEKGKENT